MTCHVILCGVTRSASAQRFSVGDGFNSRSKPHHNVEDVKRCTFCCYIRSPTLIVWAGKYLGPKQLGLNQYHAQLRHPDKGRAIKELVICKKGSRAFEHVKRSGPRLLLNVSWGIKVVNQSWVNQNSRQSTTNTSSKFYIGYSIV